MVQTLAYRLGGLCKGICWVCDRPTKLVFDGSKQLHGQRESATEYLEGFQIYAYRGLWLSDRFRQPPCQ
ncbi:hypothetical protein H6F76_02945 [Leptolyngbya sp. FACHB-321]|uniref:hypothetical protein n=1 Tax=Leptolyngbya sp. FACHB-321 TaxID=2692807 RepID=UPI0016894331|nr:hypothetical protein [Leptolyngbya sp. FACHB-321]MBD2034008.1 hypothetical protein [Leptolyngbya sp. FACHB-321]